MNSSTGTTPDFTRACAAMNNGLKTPSFQGSNDIVGGDYYFTYGDVLFIMLNTQGTKVEEHKKFIQETVAANPDMIMRIPVPR